MSGMKDLFGDKTFKAPEQPKAAEIARDEAIKRVVKNANPKWKELAIAHIKRLPSGYEGTAEAFRLDTEPAVGSPEHHNAWGGLIMGLVRAGVLTDTGRMAKMKTEKSHARKTTVWRRT